MESTFGFATYRHEGSRKNKFKLLSCVVLTSAVVLILVCGLWTLFHIVLKDLRHSRSYRADMESKPVLQRISETLKNTGCPSVCTTKLCITEAARCLKRMNTTVDPCDDFYEFACGNMPEDEPLIRDIFVDILLTEDRMHLELRELLEDSSPHVSISQNVQNLLEKRQRLYNSCITEFANPRMVPDILQFLDDNGIRNWPQLDKNWTFTDAEFHFLISRLIVTDEFRYITVMNKTGSSDDVTEHTSNTSTSNPEMMIQIFTGRHDGRFPGSCSESQYTYFFERLLEYLGLTDEEKSDIIMEIMNINKQFRTAIEDLPCSYCEKTNTTKKIIKCYEEELESVRWCSILHHIFKFAGMTDNYPSANIVFESEEFFESLELLLYNTTRRYVVHYFVINIFMNNVQYLRNVFRDPGVTHMTCLDEALPFLGYAKKAWQWCVSWMTMNLPSLLIFQYLSNENVKRNGGEISSLFYDVKENIINMISDNPWMSTGLRETLLDEVNSTLLMNDFKRTWWMDEEGISAFFQELQFTGGFFSNVLEFKRFDFLTNIRMPDAFHFHLLKRQQVLQSGASAGGKELEITAGFYSSPAFDSGRPRYLNYGFLGMILAHEIGHILYFALDYAVNKTDEDISELTKMKTCLTNHYSEYMIPFTDVKVDGNKTYTEDFPDNAGPPVMMKMHREFVSRHGDEPMLPGLHYSNEQMLFISLAQAYCEFASSEYFKSYSENPHSPLRVRVQETLKQSEDFSKAFNCAVGKPMNPEEKCQFLL